ncbi:L,D-transpeptidase [Cryptosporangium phraense]|uniref:L,D-transpeptidase n=1 Tax=Cryptosporangium phraense TaxID=2593070 RepID=A0A545AJC0_9ACTN|nr:L,D-transpeptidase [Cryptosporangium phraense]TQS41427.1 L,D-transpeptidase [Cryptosporangium phraense]
MIRRVAALVAVVLAAGLALLIPSSAQAAGCSPRTGPAQRQVEKYLHLKVDGKASQADCVAVQRFQQRMGIRPTAGYAGPLTGSIVTRLANASYSKCGANGGIRVCVDLTHQVFWVKRNSSLAYGPAPIRTGRAGLATPAGLFRIQDKKVSTVSTIFKVKLPYWERFYADMGFHQTTTYLYDGGSPGSHGCINLLPIDARTLFKYTKYGTPVKIFGKKP